MSEMQQKDLVLSINEYAYVLDKTKGNVSCWVGPAKTSLSTSDELVIFNERTKSFESCGYRDAIKLFKTAPENWYIILKNPVENDKHPTPGTSNNLPEKVLIGRKVNVRGPVSFALYPGQMAKVIKGHALRSNQYLLARVYDAESANASNGEILDSEGNKIESAKNYVNGQILVIKGTEVSFYIPPTGIEVIPIDNDEYNGFTREAVTLERLEYCILKDEDGNKRYVHGPEVVFPEPTEQFVTSTRGGYIFKAIELSPISGIYVKVIAEYKDEDGTVHPVGEEQFITGKDCMIYYPRPEHAIINYDSKILHHAIAIPEGEGRYVMDRLRGTIRTVKGPAMYLPDPRTEVVVKRKLTESQCKLWYPGNEAVLNYNYDLSEKSVEKATAKNTASLDKMLLNTTAYTASCSTVDTLAFLEANANISRGTSYTKPRTITLDNKFEGVVAIDVWTGYAINVISKNGNRRIVKGPQTVLLDYDQTLEILEMSTGKPKTTDNLIRTVYLRHENNKISDIIKVETKDFVHMAIKVSYCVNFEEKYTDRWFKVENYVKYLCDRMRSIIKRAAKNYTVEDFYQNYNEILRALILDKHSTAEKAEASERQFSGRFFKENGMHVFDCEILGLDIEPEYAKMLNAYQSEMIRKSIELNNASTRIKVAEELSRAERREFELENEKLIYKMQLQEAEANSKLEIQANINRKKEAENRAAKQAEKDMQVLLDEIAAAHRERDRLSQEQALKFKNQELELENAKKEAYAKTVVEIMKAISPDLVAAMNAKSNAELTETVTKAISPYALAKGESVADFTNKLLRGTSLEEAIHGVNLNVNKD